ncbi:divalent-cation tolerance protein CutA [Haloplanus halophilus]|uniref:divalent-cation tolerance protein CutA n=1 Tax=Haloplanus halophilus TaxID=2949993 RepID=UPI00203D554D|nr:divalent-cation tolerance protein CutA [Haloplanus sp. GDY1]
MTTTALVTAPPAEARELARRLVDRRLAACVNLVPCTSIYRWEGSVAEDDEAILLAKTTEDRFDELVDRIVEWHSYDVPCVERVDVADAHEPFASWCAEAVAEE